MNSDFVFYCGSDEATIARVRRAASAHWGDVKEIQVEGFRLFISIDHFAFSFAESSNAVGAISGYVRRENVEPSPTEDSSPFAVHNKEFVSHVIKDDNWPLDEQWTGSFSAVAYSVDKQEIVICNDPIGCNPIYYAIENKTLLGTTSLIVMSHCIDSEVDVVGTLQRITPPYCNYGRRTLLKRVSRLLPGEWLKLAGEDAQVRSVFDNSLCKETLNGDVNTIARTVWDCLQHEINQATGLADHVCVGMSGGWDSRLVLGAVTQAKSIDCYTYGNNDGYETKVARRCAKVVGARHRSFSIEDKYFPGKTDLEALVRKTEAANYMVWFTIIDSLKERAWSNEPILLGDYCESIDARNISTLSSRKARIKSFIDQLFGKKTNIQEATPEAFQEWKEKKRTQLVKGLLDNVVHLSPDLAKGTNVGLLTQELLSDLELSFARVHENLPAFAPMFDEVFGWFHKARYLGASQPLLLSSLFRPISPADSMRFLRLISTVHPRLRIRRRLMNAIAKLPEFDGLARIPSAQIPWLSARSPANVRDVVWGFRSGLDQLMIKRLLRKKNPKTRHRVLKSLDYITEYRRENISATVREWFSGKWIKPDNYLEMIKRRGNLSAWPLINLDITAPANVSILLDLCYQTTSLAKTFRKST